MKLETCKITSNLKVSDNTWVMTFKTPMKPFPGQFVMVDTFPEKLLLKPFGVADFDPLKKTVSILYRVLGKGTGSMTKKRSGDGVKVLGPFGNPETLKNALKTTKPKHAILVAGGSGVAGLICMYKYLSARGVSVTMLYGENSKPQLVSLKRFGLKNVVYVTCDGTCGEKGFVTDVFGKFCAKFEDLRTKPLVIACGPKPMLAKLKGFEGAYVLLEEYMSCGLGVCRSCVVKVRDPQSGREVNQAVCKDGPMFELSSVVL